MALFAPLEASGLVSHSNYTGTLLNTLRVYTNPMSWLLREVKRLLKRHTTREWGSQDLDVAVTLTLCSPPPAPLTSTPPLRLPLLAAKEDNKPFPNLPGRV